MHITGLLRERNNTKNYDFLEFAVSWPLGVIDPAEFKSEVRSASGGSVGPEPENRSKNENCQIVTCCIPIDRESSGEYFV